jgi:hypothetical protein
MKKILQILLLLSIFLAFLFDCYVFINCPYREMTPTPAFLVLSQHAPK